MDSISPKRGNSRWLASAGRLNRSAIHNEILEFTKVHRPLRTHHGNYAAFAEQTVCELAARSNARG